MPIISVIIPCYNHGAYIDEALESIGLEKYGNFFEVIIVDDGSTDLLTIGKLEELKKKGWNVLHQVNQGPGAARNNGIKNSTGEYILPLDADNKIIPEIFLDACRILESDSSLDIVYTYAEYFGQKSGPWIPGEFNKLRMVYANYIDACALIKKSALLSVGGYCRDMPFKGHEDWELWVNISLNGGNFYYLKKTGFFYRYLPNSLIRSNRSEKIFSNRKYVFSKYKSQIKQLEIESFDQLEQESKYLKSITRYKFKLKTEHFLKEIFGKKGGVVMMNYLTRMRKSFCNFSMFI